MKSTPKCSPRKRLHVNSRGITNDRLLSFSTYLETKSVLADRLLYKAWEMAGDSPMKRAFVSAHAVLEKEFGPRAQMLFLDGSDHDRIRRVVGTSLSRRMRGVGAHIDAAIELTLRQLGTRVEFDAVEDFAQVVPVEVIARILGVPGSDCPMFQSWAQQIVAAFNPLMSEREGERRLAAARSILVYLDALLAQRRAQPADDLVTDLLVEQRNGAPISDGEIRDNLMGLLVAGHITTTDLIANGIHLLLTHPAELTRLRSDPALMPSAIEEILRFEPPVSATARFTPADGELHSCPHAKGAYINANIRAANRDESVFKDAQRFDITRARNKHLSFGVGAHYCLGAGLARLEGAAAIAALFEAFPRLRLVDASEPPRWRSTASFRGLDHLPVSAE
jgi:cytochrome P450